MSQSVQLVIYAVLGLLLGVVLPLLLLYYWRLQHRLDSVEQELERLRSFNSGLPDSVAILDERLRIIDSISPKDDLINHSVSRSIGQTLDKALPAEAVELIRRAVQETIATQSMQTAEYNLSSPEGVRWFEGRSILLSSASPSEKPRILWVPRDITDRKLVEQAVAESEARFRSIFEHSPVGIMTADTNGLVTDLNDAYLQIIGDLGLRDAIVGNHNLLNNLIFTNAGIQHLFQNLYDTLQPFVVEPKVTTLTGKEVMVRYHGTPQLSDTGDFIGCVVICEDITDRIKAEASLRQNELRYRTISELISDFAFSFLVDADQRHVSTEWVTASFERMTGFTVNEIFGVGGWRKLVHDDDIAAIQELFRMLAQESTTTTTIRRIYTKTGDIRYIQVSLRSIWDDNQQRVTQIVGAGTDITERIQAESKDMELAAHRQQVELLANFISNMSHHFKNPLSVVNTEIALMQSLQIHHIEPHLQKIERQVSHINRIITKLSTLAQLDHDPNFEFVIRDINFILLELEVSLMQIATLRNISINIQMPHALPLIKLDDHWLSRALYELLENAIFHSPDGGTVQVTVTEDEHHVVIVITDEGPGISREHLPHLFRRFYKTDEARTNVERPGIGLTIAERIIREHGGTISVESELGSGSRWAVKLPTVESPEV